MWHISSSVPASPEVFQLHKLEFCLWGQNWRDEGFTVHTSLDAQVDRSFNSPPPPEDGLPSQKLITAAPEQTEPGLRGEGR